LIRIYPFDYTDYSGSKKVLISFYISLLLYIRDRRNSVHRQLMKDGNIDYKIVGIFDKEEEARDFELRLIKKYKQLGQAKFNKQVN